MPSKLAVVAVGVQATTLASREVFEDTALPVIYTKRYNARICHHFSLSTGIRLNSLQYGQLRDKLLAPIRTARNVVIHQSLSDRFTAAFTEQVEMNGTYELPPGSPVSVCPCVCLYVCLFACVCMCECMSMCLSVCVFVCMCLYM